MRDKKDTFLVLFVIILFIIALALLLFGDPSNKKKPKLPDNQTVEVENILLSNKTLNLKVGATHTLTPVISPSNAKDKSVTWTSSNEKVATVDANGVVTASSAGKATIKATSANGKVAECTVTVGTTNVPATSISLDKTDVVLVEGESFTLKVKVSPSNTTEHSFKWTSSNPSVATVNNGKVTALKPGTALITVMTANKKIAICDIEVKAKVITATNISLSETGKTIKVGASFTLKASITPSNVSDKSITWSSANNGIATVSNGVVKGIAPGSTTITAKTSNGKTASCIVKVEAVSTYVITEDSKYNSYQLIDSYNSSTLKYKIVRAGYQDIVIIWASNPIEQMNGALAVSNSKGVASAEVMLNREAQANKGMVAVNASFFAGGTPLGGVVLNKGRVAKNDGLSAGIIGIDSNGNLVHYANESAASLQSRGIRNTFVISSPTHIDNSQVDANRTQICQIDRNNFAILSGGGLVKACGNELMNVTGCKVVYNLDGGGSRKLYYKKNDSTLVKRYGGGRELPDMLYFIEK